MAQLDMRRGATAGAIVSLMAAATSAGWSNDQPRASIEVLAVGLVFTLLAVVVVRTIQADALSPATPADSYGGFWVRAVALALDYIPIYVVGVFLAVTGLGAIAVPALFGVAFAYFVGLWITTGQTLGMKMLGLRVARANGGDVTPTVAVRRFLGLLLSFVCLFLGVVWVAFDARKRSWADLIGGTVVVRTAAR